MSTAQSHATPGGSDVTIAPRVGIFWGVPDDGATALVTDATELSAAEPYGDFLTHPRGHYEVWEVWRRLGSAGLARRCLPAAIAFHEYEEFPRGRIVYDTREDLFVIYADRKLQGRTILTQIITAFGLTRQRTIMRSDAHYRT